MPRTLLFPGIIAGLLLGALFAALAGMADAMSYGTQEALGLAAMAIVAGGAQALAITRAAHDPASGNRLPFAPRYFLAMLTGAVTAVVFGLFNWVNFTFIDTGYLDAFYARYLERARETAAPPEQLQQVLAAAEQMKGFLTDPFSQAMIQAGSVLMIALVTGVLVAVLAGRGR